MDGLNGGLSVDHDRGGPDESRTDVAELLIGYSPLPEALTATRLIYALRNRKQSVRLSSIEL